MMPEEGPPFFEKALETWLFLCVAVNVFAIGLIYLRMRRGLKPFLSRKELQIYVCALAFLAENALPLGLMGIIYAYVAPPTSAQTVARTIILLLWWCINVGHSTK